MGLIVACTFSLAVGLPGGSDAAGPPKSAAQGKHAIAPGGLELSPQKDSKARHKSVFFGPRSKAQSKGKKRSADREQPSSEAPDAGPPTPPPVDPGASSPAPLSDHARQRAQVRRFAKDRAIKAGKPIEDDFGRTVGFERYRSEIATDLPLRLSAIVDPNDGAAFAAIRNEKTGLAGAYRAGTEVSPGVWVVRVESGVVHLLDLRRSGFQYLTFAKSSGSSSSKWNKGKKDRKNRKSKRKRG